MAQAPQRRATSTGKSASQRKGPVGGLSPLQVTLAAKALSTEAPKWRDAVEPGQDQAVDVIIWITGKLAVGEDGYHHPKRTPELVDVLAFFYARLEPETRKTLHAALLRAFKQRAAPALDDDAKHLATIAVEAITSSESKSKRGAVSVHDVRITKLPRSAADST